MINPVSKEQVWRQDKSIKINENKNIFDPKTKYKYLKSPKKQNFSVDSVLLDFLKPDAQRLQDRSITEDGVHIPLNYELLRRPKPVLLHEPVDISLKSRLRVNTDEDYLEKRKVGRRRIGDKLPSRKQHLKLEEELDRVDIIKRLRKNIRDKKRV